MTNTVYIHKDNTNTYYYIFDKDGNTVVNHPFANLKAAISYCKNNELNYKA